MSDNEREAELAGAWYPGTASECRRALVAYDDALQPGDADGALHGAVVPHAGWVFSGAIAHEALATLAHAAGEIDTVVLFAGHMRPGARPTVMVRGDFWTPIGNIATDEALAGGIAEAMGDGIVAEEPRRHSQDNAFEVQFPLIKHIFPDAAMVALGAPPDGQAEALARTVLSQVERLDRRAVFVGSTDLTHYGPNYGWSPEGSGEAAERWVKQTNDPLFIDATLELAPAPMIELARQHRNACCPGSAAAAAVCAVGRGATTGRLLRYATSADIHRSSSFVGYAGIVF